MKKIIVVILFLFLGIALGLGGMWLLNENQKPKTHQAYCQKMAQDYLASIKDKMKVTDYEWEWGVRCV